jgi:hypothetical protein
MKMEKSKVNITKKINLIVVILFPNNKNKINNINIKNTAMSKDDIKIKISKIIINKNNLNQKIKI